jgi:hypothetical protein
MKTIPGKLIFSALALALCLFTACSTDDLKSDIEMLKGKMDKLEAIVDSMNDEIAALKVFAEGGRTILSYDEIKNSDGSIVYEITLSNGDELVLRKGGTENIQYPPISIDEEGYWLINGVRQEVKAIGENAATPKFRVSDDNYWQVNTRGTDNDADYEYVLTAAGDKVEVKVDGGSGEVFENVWVEDGVFYVKMFDAPEYGLPIVEGLVAIIEKPAGGRWLEETGEWLVSASGSSTNVTIKGDNAKYFVTAPAGWKAEISDVDAAGKAVLTLTPSAAAIATRASADNTADVVLQVNKGLYWAIDKIKVTVGDPASPFSDYNNGKPLVIGDLTVTKDEYGEAVLITADSATKKIVPDHCVYFVEPGVTVEWTDGKPKSGNKYAVVVVGNGDDRSAVLQSEATTRITFATAGESLLFAYKNMTVLSSRTQFSGAGERCDVYIDNCTYKQQHIAFNFSGVTIPVVGINITNSSVDVVKTPVGVDFIQNYGNGKASFKLENNIFFSSFEGGNQLLLGKAPNIGTISMHNNIFMNLALRSESALITSNGKVDKLECSKNVFYDLILSGKAHSIFKIVTKSGEFENPGPWEDNIHFATVKQTFYPILPVPEGEACPPFLHNFVGSDSPVDEINLQEGTFTMKSEYAEYGPQK